eukprot:CAMPEP_0197743210 /NCGR_PEP_ID=MMETSP1435-20131217/34313_1 /TAXON_ID=426625 /ORGANISM="Chaetoceros brevis, Strain CCMP164" /LENGTH=64 /DNA_ID=CAMNT_0043334059 /DNA_START=676 /DNA_END=870 /DNA_ORIENTATION=-
MSSLSSSFSSEKLSIIARLNPDGCDELHVGEPGSFLISAGHESECVLIGGIETDGPESLRVAGV